MSRAIVHCAEIFKEAERRIAKKWEHCSWCVYLPQEEPEDEDDLWGSDIGGDDDIWGIDLDIEEPEQLWLQAYPLVDPSVEQLGKLQVWNEKDLLLVIPRVLLEDRNIVVQNGDMIVLDEHTYKIVEVIRWGFWMDSDLFLLAILNCQALS